MRHDRESKEVEDDIWTIVVGQRELCCLVSVRGQCVRVFLRIYQTDVDDRRPKDSH